MSGSATRRATIATGRSRGVRSGRDRQTRLWEWAQTLFFASLIVWFLAFARGLLGRVAPLF